ncbi:hypothetical protein MASR2M78_34700 [Treponema sp.]
MGKPKLRDVAEAVGVSLTTASLALSGKGRISDEIREAIEEAAMRLGYHKKASEALVPRAKLNCILMNMDPEWEMVFSLIRPIIAEIVSSCKKRGELVVLVPITMDEPDEDIFSKLEDLQCSGLFSIHFARASLFDRLEKQGIPVVVIMNAVFQDRYSSVLADDFQGAYEGALHLLKLGHERIVYLDTDRLGLQVLSSDRFDGFKKALDEQGIVFPLDHKILVPVNDIEYMGSRAHSLMASSEPPTAFFTLDDQIAVRLNAILRSAGIRVPEDVSILAPGDTMNYNDPSVPRITTMRINARLMGRIAAEMMAERFDNPGSERHVIKIKLQLIQRGSTKAKSGIRHGLLVRDGSSRALVLSAFAHERSIRVPKWLGASPEFLAKVQLEQGMNEEAFRRCIGDDVRVVRLESSPSDALERRGPFGVERSGSGYGQPLRHPIASSLNVEALRSFPWPDPEDADVSGLRKLIESMGDEFAIFGGDPSTFWHDAIDLVGLENLSMLMYDDQDFVSTLFGRIADYRIAVSTRIFEEAGDLIDVFLIRNDFGSQNAPLIGPDHFQRFLVPVLRRFTELGHRFGIKVMLNSAGAIRPLIPMIIESGIDAVHALQPDCPGMRPASLRKEFGSSLILSGLIDARGALLNGTSDQVRSEVRSVLDEITPGGGYLAAPSVDALTEDVPVTNVLAMYEEINAYRLRS